MALKWVDPFTFWTTTPGTFTTTASEAGPAPSISSGRFASGNVGSRALISNGLTQQATYIINARFNVSLLGNGNPIVGGFAGGSTPIASLMEGAWGSGNAQCGLCIRTDGKLQFYRGSTTPIGGVSTIALSADSGVTFYDVEMKVTVNNSTGSIEARVNGGVEIGPTTVNTRQTSNNYADSIAIWGMPSGSNTNIPSMLIEHLIVMDGSGSLANDFIGPVDVDFLPPTGDGNYTAWAPNTGARWDAVNDSNPDGDTTYVSASVVGDKITFTRGTLPAGTTTIKATGQWFRARRDDGVTRAFKGFLRSSGTDHTSTVEHFLGDSYQWFFTPYEQSPFTSTAWTVSEINNLEFGAIVST